MIPKEVADIANKILAFFSEPKYHEDDWDLAVQCAWEIYNLNKE